MKHQICGERVDSISHAWGGVKRLCFLKAGALA